MASRGFFAFLSLIFTAGALVMMFFILLAGTTSHSPVNKFWFLEVDTSKIPGAAPLSRWTYWNICTVGSDGLDVCPAVHPAFPLDPPSGRNFGTTTGIPPQFIGTRKYFFMTRFMYCFMLIATFFGVCSFFTGVLALCSRIGSYLSGLLAMLSLLFQTCNVCLMTAAYVIGRDNFRSNGQTANLGEYAFGFEWGAWAALLIATVLFCLAGGNKKNDPTEYSTKPSFFSSVRREKSTRSRGSFIDGDRKEFA